MHLAQTARLERLTVASGKSCWVPGEQGGMEGDLRPTRTERPPLHPPDTPWLTLKDGRHAAGLSEWMPPSGRMRLAPFVAD